MLKLQSENELKPLLLQIHQLASNPDSDQEKLKAISSQVSNLLIGGFNLDWNLYEHITFVPRGMFNLVPFNLLMTDFPNITVARIPSISTLVSLRDSAITREAIKRPKVLAVGGVVDATNPDSHLAFRELDDLDNAYSGVTVVRPNAGGEAPELDKLLGFDIVHVSAHCISNDTNPQLSAIALDPTNPDMMIRASALKDVRLDTRLVVLSRCFLANEEEPTGEGLQVLASSFLEAGVLSLVVALWEVEDEPTGFFMNAFYEGLAQGENAAKALVLARKKCQQDPEFNRPHFWGAFVLVGDGQVKVPLQAQRKFGGMVRPMALLAGVGAGLFFILRMRR